MLTPYLKINGKKTPCTCRLNDGSYAVLWEQQDIKEYFAYKEIAYTTPGTHTFTVPKAVFRLRVAVCGAGGGCALVAEDDNDTHNGHKAGDGGASSFGSELTAAGGTGGNAQCNSSSAWGVAGAGGLPNGRPGTHGGGWKWSGTTAGGQGYALGFNGTDGEYGSGGYAYSSAHAGSSNAAGGGGAFTTKYIDVTPGDSYTVVVGAPGNNRCTYWEGGSTTFYTGSAGFVLVGYGNMDTAV